MKKIYSLILCAVMAFIVGSVVTVDVKADEATLSEMTVEAQNNAGSRSKVTISPEFSADVTEYKVTVPNDTIKLVITATTTEESAKYEVDWEALDVGDNKTFVYVTTADGTKSTYTIYTKRLTEEEEATYKPEENNDSKPSDEENDTPIMVGETKMKISSDFDESDIPEGFSEAEYEYEGKTYTVIKGEKKNLVAMWLKPISDETSENSESGEQSTEEQTGVSEEGFYIYAEEDNTFYEMNNIYIKSRMYTVIENAAPDQYLNDYERLEIQVIDENVEVWVLDEDNRLYLLYAMNWEGETSLYCYDDVEKCFQRYIIDSAAANQVEAANEAINNLQNKNNDLIKKYNDSNSTKWKIIAVLAILVVVLFFTCINLFFSLKTKQLGDDDFDDYSKPSKSEKKEARTRKRKELHKEDYSYDSDDDDELFKLIEDDDFLIVSDNSAADSSESVQKDDFSLDEIDISEQVMKEMAAPVNEQVPVGGKAFDVNEKTSFKSQKEEPFNEESLQSILQTAFPNEDTEDDDGFTFI